MQDGAPFGAPPLAGMRLIILSLAAGLVFAAPAISEPPEVGAFVFDNWDGPALRVFYAEADPARFPSAPVVLVLHGVNRNADDYRDNWIGLAETYGLRVYAPEFTTEAFPGAAMYNLGGAGTTGPYAFAALEPLFDAVAARGEPVEGYHLFGHSAGAQVAHRAVLLESLPRLEAAYAANAGWYTAPDPGVGWPYGLGGAEINEDAERAWFAAPLVVMLGEDDDDPAHRNLRRTAEADAQGPHRYARGEFFLAAAEARSEALGAPLAWRRIDVPGVAHDNARMAQAAAADIAARNSAPRP